MARASGELDLRVGGRIGDYRLHDVLGVGATAIVYAATGPEGDVALKVLQPQYRDDPRIRERLIREARASNLVAHPAAVPASGCHEESGVPFLVLERLFGATLQEVLRRAGRLDSTWVTALMDEVLDFCDRAHGRGIVHRDLKPGNLFLTVEGPLRILDLGVAKLPELAVSGFETRTHALLGTPGYMSPEQARADSARVDARSDLWSVGATAFQLLSGQTVHRAASAEELRELTMVVPAPSIATVAPHLPRDLVAWVDRALALEPEDRWPTAAKMRAALHAAQGEPDFSSVTGAGVDAHVVHEAATTVLSTARDEQPVSAVLEGPRTRRLGSWGTDEGWASELAVSPGGVRRRG